MAKKLHEYTGTRVEPMQLAAILLETTTESLAAEDAEKLVTYQKKSHGR